MDKYLTLGLVLGAITVIHGGLLPTMMWNDDDVSLMCLISTDYYNKMSGESALYRLHGNEYKMLVKSCAAAFMMEDDRDVVVVTCDNVTQQRSRVRRSRNGGRGGNGGGRGGNGGGRGGRGGGNGGGRGGNGGGRGGRGGGRPGSGSIIAGGGSRGKGSYA